jgi:hypothetical protein
MRDRLGFLSMQAKFGYLSTYTVQISAPSIVVPGQDVRSLAEAQITWTVEGNRVRRRVTVGNGVSVTGTAESVEVIVRDVTLDGAAFPAGFDPSYVVSAQVTRGTRPAQQQPPTLIPDPPDATWVQGAVAVPALNASTGLVVPSDTGAIALNAVIVSDAPAGAVLPQGSVTIMELEGGVVRREYDPREYGAWVPLLPSASSVVVRNYNAGTSIRASLLFGIDG